MIDRTDDFKNALKTLKKVQSLEKECALEDPKVMSRRRNITDFGRKTSELVKSISQLRSFLLEHRAVYINASHIQQSTAKSMSDYERDKIDEEAQNIIKVSSEAISTMRQSLISDSHVEQVIMHRQYVLDLIESHLKSVCKIYSEQRAIRVKLVVDRKRISRLHNPETHKKSILESSAPVDSVPDRIPQSQDRKSRSYVEDSEEELSENEAAALEQENQLIFNDMNTMVDEVKAIEGKVIEIARLQEIFSEQVMKQEDDIEMISDKVLEGTENIKGGNEALREAIKNNAGFRVWILFFLVMCSFSLLFLEWYS